MLYKQEKKKKKLTWGPNDNNRCLGPFLRLCSFAAVEGHRTGLGVIVGGVGGVGDVVVERGGGREEGAAIVVDGGGERRVMCAGSDVAVCFVIHKRKHNDKHKCCIINKDAIA